MHPFLKWPGGKRWLVSRYHSIFPSEFNTYYEPFLGGGSVFFHLMPQKALISDINKELINTYHNMAKNPIRLRELLEEHQIQHSCEHYYDVRDHIPDDDLLRAARFLYLNRTCFNGMYRVNQNGLFNVPIGTKNHFTEDTYMFEDYSIVLRRVHIRNQDFVKTIRSATDGDLVFADPPYAVANNQNSFIKYNEKLFSWKDQERLLNALIKARDRGAIVISTNAIYSELRRKYIQNGFYTQAVNRFSSISGNATGRGTKAELLISSFPIGDAEF